jgi:glyoxylase-like metal-dependent hydrolase (beta-lactamase superfamily II)
MPYEVQTWRVGHVTITCIQEKVVEYPPGLIYAGLTEDRVKAVDWLRPHWATEEGLMRVAFQAYVVETAGRRIIIDTCIGADKERTLPDFHRLSSAFLERLSEAGYPPDSIDYVLCTHLHVDHVGWNTRWDGTRWVPTFPKARYLLGRLEWEHWKGEVTWGDEVEAAPALLEAQVVMADSVRPVVDAGLADFVETDHRLTDEVSLIPTPGHTLGHVSVVISSAGQKAIITGDAVAHPIQLHDPSICVAFDHDRKLAEATRRRFFGDHADQDVLILGTHFDAPSGGKIVSNNEVWRFAPVPVTPRA